VFSKNTILIIGDSISAGYGIDPKQGWVSLLQHRLDMDKRNYHVINASISGDTTSDGLSRIPTALNQYHPSITIIELGGNDGLRGLQISVIKSNLQRMISLTKQANSHVIILGVRIPPNYGEIYTQQFQQIYLDFAKRSDIIVIPLFLKNIDDHSQLMQADGIHPATNAQALLLDNIWPALTTLLQQEK